MRSRWMHGIIASITLALAIVAIAVISRDSVPVSVAEPCEGGGCEPRDVSGLSLPQDKEKPC